LTNIFTSTNIVISLIKNLDEFWNFFLFFLVQIRLILQILWKKIAKKLDENKKLLLLKKTLPSVTS
jgi:hypothetical protein